eukprot:g4024.t1
MREDEHVPQVQDTESEVGSLEDFPVFEEYANDTSAEEYALGRDIQGVPWERLRRSRAEHRVHRLQTYRNYTNVLNTQGTSYQQYLKRIAKRAVKPRQQQFFDFVSNSRRIKSSIVHFQLRNLLQATTKHDLYVMKNNCVNHWNLMSGIESRVLDFRRGGLSGFGGDLDNINISTLTTGGGLLAVGGFSGQLIVQRLSDLEIIHESLVTRNDNAITNAIEVFGSDGDLKILTSNNDAFIRIFDICNFKMAYKYQSDWAVNYSTVCPLNSKIIAMVGDDLDGRLLDRSSNRVICQLVGHEDYSFAAAWNPSNEHELATGNQDLTTRIWDIRSPNKQLKILKGKMGAIRSLRYSSDGAFLLMAEPTDLVHLYDVKSDYQSAQEIDIFGEISGAVFSPDGDMIFISIFDESYSCLVQFRRNHTMIKGTS